MHSYRARRMEAERRPAGRQTLKTDVLHVGDKLVIWPPWPTELESCAVTPRQASQDGGVRVGGAAGRDRPIGGHALLLRRVGLTLSGKACVGLHGDVCRGIGSHRVAVRIRAAVVRYDAYDVAVADGVAAVTAAAWERCATWACNPVGSNKTRVWLSLVFECDASFECASVQGNDEGARSGRAADGSGSSNPDAAWLGGGGERRAARAAGRRRRG